MRQVVLRVFKTRTRPSRDSEPVSIGREGISLNQSVKNSHLSIKHLSTHM